MNHRYHVRCAALLCILSLLICLFGGCDTAASPDPSTSADQPSASVEETAHPKETVAAADWETHSTASSIPFPEQDNSTYPVLIGTRDENKIYTDSYLWDIENCELSFQRSHFTCQGVYNEDGIAFQTLNFNHLPRVWDGNTRFIFESAEHFEGVAFSPDSQIFDMKKPYIGPCATNLLIKKDGADSAVRWIDAGEEEHDYPIADVPLSDEAKTFNVLNKYSLIYASKEGPVLHLFFWRLLMDQEETLSDGCVAAPYDFFYARYLPEAPEQTQWKHITISAEDSAYFTPDWEEGTIYFSNGKLYLPSSMRSVTVVDTETGTYHLLSDATDPVMAMFPQCQTIDHRGIPHSFRAGGQWGNYLIIHVPLYESDNGAPSYVNNFCLAINADTGTIAGAMHVRAFLDQELWEETNITIDLYDENLQLQTHLTSDDFPRQLFGISVSFAKEPKQ